MDQQEKAHGSTGPHWLASLDPELIKHHDNIIYVPAKALNIVWGNVMRFWQWITLDNVPRFETGAELLQVNWIDVTRKLDISACTDVSTSRTYEVLWIVKFNVDAFGWHSCPIEFKVAAGGHSNQSSIILEKYKKEAGIWHEIPGGEFTVSPKSTEVEFGMYEVNTDWWKGSMVLAGVKLKPK